MSNLFIKINNRNNFLLKDIKQIHPATRNYIKYWRKHKRRVIEGFWAPDNKDINYDVESGDLTVTNENKGSWRYMPSNLYFYVNFGTILHRPKEAPKTAPKKPIRPHLRDFDWEFFYNWSEARGFSGFKNDDKYTCLREVKKYEDGKYDISGLEDTAFDNDGNVKKYIEAKIYLRQLHKEPLGLALFDNEAKNMFLLGARGGGKSMSTGVGIILHEIITDGAKEYTEQNIENPFLVELFVGAAMSSKSSDLLSKVKLGLEYLPGAWNPGKEGYVPSPLYKHMNGSLQPNNMKKPWAHRYEKKVGGEWKWFGSGSNIKHGIFSTENPEAAAGGRYTVIVIEEVGLLGPVLTVHGGNEAAQMTDGTIKFGSSMYLGTGGNILKIVESEIIFRDPESFDMLAFDDVWEDTGNIGWFVPATHMDGNFKDENGNTMEIEVLKNYEERRELKRKAKSSSALDLEMMNYPLVPSEMFLSKGHNGFPIADLKSRLAELLSSNRKLDSSWKGWFDLKEDGKIEWNNDKDVKPIIEYPLPKKSNNINGCIEIFEMPVKNSDNITDSGTYIASLDPVDDDDDSDNELSLQSVFIMNNLTGRIVAEYTGRTKLAKDFYEQTRRLLLFYNAKINYENNKKGFYPHMFNKNCLYLLAETPEILKDKDMQKSAGFGNKSLGTNANLAVNNWGLELIESYLDTQAYNKEDGVTNIQTIRSIGLLHELIKYNGKLNADRVSSLGLLLILRENTIKFMRDNKKKKDEIIHDKFWSRIVK